MITIRKPNRLTLFLGGLGLSTFVFTAVAADWIIAPAVTLEQSYTDNAHLTLNDEVSESITVIRPSVSIYREGARASVDFNYAPEYRNYWEGTEDDELIHFMRAEGDVELIEQHLFLDGWATADLINVTSSSRTGLSGLTGRDDTTEVYTAGLSPYFKTRLGRISLFEARYTLDNITYSEDGLDDSVGQRADLVFGSGPAFTNQVWEVSAMSSQTDYETLDEDTKVTQFRAEYAQQLTRQWALAFVAGYEEFKLTEDPDVDDSLWSVGVIYTPSPRTRLALGGGERAFGDDYYLDFAHRARRTIWTASYERDYVSAREELMRPRLFLREDAFGNLVRDAVLENPIPVDRGGAPEIGAEYYELERIFASMTFESGRTELTLSGDRTERVYTDASNNTLDTSAFIGMSRELSPRSSAYLEITGIDHEEINLYYKQWVAVLGGSIQLAEAVDLGFRLAHLDRDVEIEILSYAENSFSIYLTATF